MSDDVSKNSAAHLPVMRDEIIGYLNLKDGDVVLDATVGGGGHSEAVLERIGSTGRLIGLDADKNTLDITQERLKKYGSTCRLINDNFRNIDNILHKEEVKGLNAVVFDLGVSSYQFDEGARGFSIKRDGPLDMRMDPRIRITAFDIVNRYSEKELSQIIRNFGEERYHNRIARYIAHERATKKIETTYELVGIIHRAIGGRSGKSKIDPATRTFQAIRIAVNDELGALEEGLSSVIKWMLPGARICVVSFHSLEDRIVKHTMKKFALTGEVKIISKKPFLPSRPEIIANARARSAKLRVAERI